MTTSFYCYLQMYYDNNCHIMFYFLLFTAMTHDGYVIVIISNYINGYFT